MSSSQTTTKAAGVSVAFSVGAFVLGAILLRQFVCTGYGPTAFAASHLFALVGAVLIGVSAFRQRSLVLGIACIAVILLGGVSVVAGIGLAIPGCSGV